MVEDTVPSRMWRGSVTVTDFSLPKGDSPHKKMHSTIVWSSPRSSCMGLLLVWWAQSNPGDNTQCTRFQAGVISITCYIRTTITLSVGLEPQQKEAFRRFMSLNLYLAGISRASNATKC
jgi:hypothetical protein